MADKAYIVANKEQELEVLKRFEQKGFPWNACENAMSFVPSERFNFNENNFPYMLMITNDNIWWSVMKTFEDETIVYDGRKEEKMYKVTQEFMNAFVEWRDKNDLDAKTGSDYEFVVGENIQNIPFVIGIWWTDLDNPIENNNRLIAIIQWLNGEDVFEVEEPHKFVVRSKEIHSDGYYSYVKVVDQMALNTDYNLAMKFDTREEAQEWANSHQVVVEIDEEGNEFE